MGEKFVLMFHPDIENSQAAVGTRAFEKVWEPKGWELAEAAVTGPLSGSPIIDFDNLDDLDTTEEE